MVIRAFLVEDKSDISDTLIESMQEMAALRFTGLAKTEAAARSWLSANDGQWELLIVDLFLGEGSGFGVLRDCQRRTARQKVVVLTSYAPDNIVQHCLELGADAVFDKSHEVEELVMFCLRHAANLDCMNGATSCFTDAPASQSQNQLANEPLIRQYHPTVDQTLNAT